MGLRIYIQTQATEVHLKTFGVYAIRNILNGKMYIGSTTCCFNKRLGAHFCNLNNNKHKNLKLQNAWNKYGSKSFEFLILEQVADKNLVKDREQNYLDAHDKSILYNIKEIATCDIRPCSQKVIDEKSKEWVLVSPQKEVIYIKNMRNYCRENGLPQSVLWCVANNRSKQYKGWLAYYKENFSLEKMELDYARINGPKYILTDKDNNEYKVKHGKLRAFCNDKQIDPAAIFHCLSGYLGQTAHKGWRIKLVKI